MTRATDRRTTLPVLAGAIAILLLPATLLAQAPGQVSNPVPANGATNVPTDTALSWSPGTGAVRYDVRLGTTTPPPVVLRNSKETTYRPTSALQPGTTYYWQVDSRGKGNSVTAGPVWSFTTAAAPQTATLDRLRVMTWNIKSGQSLSGAPNIDAQVALMADAGAHVIILQEVTITTTADLSVRYESGLEALTGQEWHSVWAPAPRPSTSTPEGNLLLTTLPILESSTLAIDSVPSDPTWLDTKRSAVLASVAVNGTIVNVIGTHLAVNASQRASQMQTLLNWIATFPAPRLVGGDFNMVLGEAAYTAMAGAFADVWPQLAFGDQGFTMDKRTSADDQPGRIDYWWQENVSPEAGATEIWVVKTRRSDHHALIVDVEVR